MLSTIKMNNFNKQKVWVASLLAILVAIPIIAIRKAEAANEIVTPSCSFSRVANALGDNSTLKLGNGYYPSTTKQPIDPLKKDMKYIIDWGDGTAKENYPSSGYVKSYNPVTATPAEAFIQHKYGAVGKYTAKMMVQSIDGRTTAWANCSIGAEIYTKPTMTMSITPNPVDKGTAATIKWTSTNADRGCYIGTTPEETGLGTWDATHKIFTITKGGSTSITLNEPVSGSKSTGVIDADTVFYGICKSKYDSSLVSRVALKVSAAATIEAPSGYFGRSRYAVNESSIFYSYNYYTKNGATPLDPLRKDIRYAIDWGDGSQIEYYPKTGFEKSYDPNTKLPSVPPLYHKYTTAGTYDVKMQSQSIDGRTSVFQKRTSILIYEKPVLKVSTVSPIQKGSIATVKWTSQYANRGCYIGTNPAETGIYNQIAPNFFSSIPSKVTDSNIYLKDAENGEKKYGPLNDDLYIFGFCKRDFDISNMEMVHIVVADNPPTITWTPPSANIDYGSKLNFGYTTKDAVSCSAKNIKEGQNIVNNPIDISNNPLQQSWSGTYYADFTRRVECQNSVGQSAVVDFVVTVKQPPILAVSNTDAGGNVIPGNNIMSLAFGNYTIGQPGIRKTIAVINKGGGTLSGNILIPNGAFKCIAGCNFSLASGGIQKITLEFKTNVKGSQSTGATVSSNASNLVLQLFGNAVERFTADASLDFGDVAIGKSKFMTLTIKDNTPPAPGVTPLKINPSSSFFTCDKTCNIQVPIGGEQKIRIKFTPTTIKQYVETLSFSSIIIPTTGNGVKPVFNVREQ